MIRLLSTTHIQNKIYNEGSKSWNVLIQDQTTAIIDLHLSQKLNDVTILSGSTRGSESFALISGHSFVVNDYIEIWENGFWQQSEVVDVSGDVIQIDAPLAFDVINPTSVKRTNVNLTVDGSTTQVEFTFEPKGILSYDIVRSMGVIIHAAAGDDGKFGDIVGGLTNGLYFYKLNPTLPTDGFLFNVKTNGAFRERTYDLIYSDRAGVPSGSYSTGFRRTFGGQDKNGVVVRVDGNNGESIKVVIRDDLTDLTRFHMIIQGHLTDI